MPGRSLNGGVQPAARASAAAALPTTSRCTGVIRGRTWPGPFPQPLVPLVPRNQGNPPEICSGGVERTPQLSCGRTRRRQHGCDCAGLPGQRSHRLRDRLPKGPERRNAQQPGLPRSDQRAPPIPAARPHSRTCSAVGLRVVPNEPCGNTVDDLCTFRGFMPDSISFRARSSMVRSHWGLVDAVFAFAFA